MYGRSFAIAAAAAMLASSPALAQQPAAAKDVQPNTAAAQRSPTLLASATELRMPAAVKDATEGARPKPHRNARVTTCRCAEVTTPQN